MTVQDSNEQKLPETLEQPETIWNNLKQFETT
jgi:hypothetical protein